MNTIHAMNWSINQTMPEEFEK